MTTGSSAAAEKRENRSAFTVPALTVTGDEKGPKTTRTKVYAPPSLKVEAKSENASRTHVRRFAASDLWLFLTTTSSKVALSGSTTASTSNSNLERVPQESISIYSQTIKNKKGSSKKNMRFRSRFNIEIDYRSHFKLIAYFQAHSAALGGRVLLSLI